MRSGRRSRADEPLPFVLSGWPGWAAFAALAGSWAVGIAAAPLVAVGFAGASPAAGRLALAVLAAAGSAGVLAWLAARTGGAAPGHFGVRPFAPRRAAAAIGAAVLAVAVACAAMALGGALEGLRAPRELTRLDGLAWAAGFDEPAVPFDGSAVASVLARAVIATAVLELVLRGVVAPALARLVGAWPAIVATALIGGVSYGSIAGDGRLLVPAVVLGAVLGPLAVATGSIVPGAALSAGFAGAAIGASCGWGLAGATLVALASAALSAGALLAVAGRVAAQAGGRLPSPRTGRLAADGGQTAAEYMGVLLVVAVIVAAVAMSGVGTKISDHIALLVCRIAGGDCSAQQVAVDKDCLVSSSINSGSGAVLVAIVKVGEDSTLIKQVFADGRTVFTLIKSGTVAAELIAGAKARAGKVGFDATAAASAGGKLDGARTYTFTDPKKAEEFEDMVRKHGSFEQGLRDTVEGFDPGGVKDWVLDHTVGEDVDAGDLPQSDSTWVNAQAFVKGEALAVGNVIIADAGARALLQYAGGARIYTSGDDKGKVELNLRIDAEAAAHLGLVTFGPEITGKATFIARVTLDKDHGYRPSQLKIIGTAGYNGDLGDSDIVLMPTGNQLKKVQEALKRGKLKGAAFGSTDGSGQQVEFTADMDLTSDAERAEALALFTGSVPSAIAAGDLARRMEEGGRLTFQVYDTTSSSTEAGVLVGVGPGVGVEGSQTRDDRDLGGSWVRDPGGSWRARNCGRPK